MVTLSLFFPTLAPYLLPHFHLTLRNKMKLMENPNSKSNRPMADMEMNAALALTEMGKIEKNSERKSTKRIKNASADLDAENSKHACSVEDDPRDSAVVVEERVEVEQNTELSASNICCPSIQTSSFGRRPKQNMTEAEKEAKRIRRVLANRQSARQTILRRQAIREELSKKVADLSLDNENMKMEKELLSKVCTSLENRNKQLKEQVHTLQMAKMIKCEGVELEIPTSPSTELSLVSSSKLSQYVRSPWPIVSPETFGRYAGGNACRDVATKEFIEETTSASINLEEMPMEHDHRVPGPSLVEKTDKPDIPVSEKAETRFVQSHNRSIDPVAAAEARKRRKELKKLKFHHARHISLRSS